MNANEVMIKFKGWENVKWIEERTIVSEEERNRIQAHMIWENVKVLLFVGVQYQDGHKRLFI